MCLPCPSGYFSRSLWEPATTCHPCSRQSRTFLSWCTPLRSYIGRPCPLLSAFGWIGIVAVAIRLANPAVLVVDLQLCSLVAADLAGGVDSILLLIKVMAGLLGAAAFDVP